MWQVHGKKILIIGAARSGLAAAEYLHKKGAMVTLTDAKPAEKLGETVLALQKMGIKLVLGFEPEISKESFDMAVISPGVPLGVPLVQKIKQVNIPLIGEVELAFRFSQAPFVAITGTNGKTTTTALLGEIFPEAGLPVFVGGNIGTPLISGIEHLSNKHVVVGEVSSFQLETVESFDPKVAVIINITPDHLDRHGTMEGYTEAKAEIFRNQQANDFTVLNYDDSRVRELADRTSGKVVFFSRHTVLKDGVHAAHGDIIINIDGKSTNVINRNDIYIKGGHNLENALAATAAAYCMGVAPESIAKTLKNFKGVAHRQELVAEIKGVTYINDSKGTNPDSTIKALEAYDRPIVLIAGGKNKDSDFSELAELIKKKVSALILVGEAAPIIKTAVEKENFSNIYQAKDFPETVSIARQIAKPGEIVLLSPACASWDMFNSFEERGDLFKSLVLAVRG